MSKFNSMINNNNLSKLNEFNKRNNFQDNNNDYILSYEDNNIDNNYRDNNMLLEIKNNVSNIPCLIGQNKIQLFIKGESNNNINLKEIIEMIDKNFYNYNKELESKILNNFKSKLENIKGISVEENESITLYSLEEFDKNDNLEKYEI